MYALFYFNKVLFFTQFAHCHKIKLIQNMLAAKYFKAFFISAGQ